MEKESFTFKLKVGLICGLIFLCFTYGVFPHFKQMQTSDPTLKGFQYMLYTWLARLPHLFFHEAKQKW